MKESYMQAKVREKIYARYGKAHMKAGKLIGAVRVLKLSTLAQFGEVGWMDLCFWVLGGYVFLIEMKAPMKIPNANQENRILELKALGFNVYVSDNIDAAVAVASKEIDAALCRARKHSDHDVRELAWTARTE